MRETIKKNLEPAIDKFVSSLITELDKVKTQQASLDRRIKDATDTDKDLKQRIADNNKKATQVRAELTRKILDFNLKNDELGKELAQQRRLRDEALSVNKQAKSRLKEAENVIKLREQEFERAKEKTKQITQKLDALKLDDVTINNKRMELADLKRKLDTQNTSQKREAERLMDKEISLMSRENKVKQAEKRYIFEKAKKENE